MADCESVCREGGQGAKAGLHSPFTDLHPALSEANHRICNNLSLLASSVSIRAAHLARQDELIESHDVATMLYEVSARIATVGQLHRLLSKSPEKSEIDLRESLRELCETLISALSGPEGTELIWAASGECIVTSAHVLPLCLIVTEVVTNSLKYAHPTGVAGKLMVGCHRDADESLFVEVADDGIGLPDGFDIAVDGGIGAKTIRLLARQIGADIEFDSSGIGVEFALRLPQSELGYSLRV
jgi:two-component sensor histidine kinase